MTGTKADTRIQILIAVIGLAGLLGAAVITNLDKIAVLFQHPVATLRPGSSSPEKPNTPKTTSNPVASPGHAMLNQGQFSFNLSSGPLHYYDFDKSQEFPSEDNSADFFFKPNSTPDGTISVRALGKAMMAQQFSGRQPWELDYPQSFESQATASIPQNTSIPCITNYGSYCAFSVDRPQCDADPLCHVQTLKAEEARTNRAGRSLGRLAQPFYRLYHHNEVGGWPTFEELSGGCPTQA